MLITLSELNFKFSRDQRIREASKVKTDYQVQNLPGDRFIRRKQSIMVEHVFSCREPQWRWGMMVAGEVDQAGWGQIIRNLKCHDRQLEDK